MMAQFARLIISHHQECLCVARGSVGGGGNGRKEMKKRERKFYQPPSTHLACCLFSFRLVSMVDR